MKSLFNKKYVYFEWEDELEGKEGFFADDIEDLRADVNNNSYKAKTSESMNSNAPFCDDKSKSNWQFFYYDPNYECKRAYAEGKPFQYKARDTGKWCYWNYSFSPECSFSDDVEYRIPPKAEEPKSRPFEDTAELILHYQQHFNAVCPPYAEPLIWVKNKDDNRYLITGYEEKCVLIADVCHDMNDLFNDYIFLDGSPCGVKE